MKTELPERVPDERSMKTAPFMMDQPLLVTAILEHAQRWYPTTEVVTRSADGSLHRCTYADVGSRARQLAAALLRMNVRQGDRVATIAWNTNRHLEAFFAIPGIGAVCHTINPRLSRAAIRQILRAGGSEVMLVDPEFLPIVEEITRDQPLRHVIVLTSESLAPEAAGAVRTYEELLRPEDAQRPWESLDERCAAGICFTSGSTGEPKGVAYSHRSLVLQSLVMSGGSALNIVPEDVILPIVPMYHVVAWGVPYIAPLLGAKLVFPGRQLDGASLFDLMDQERVTIGLGVPTVWKGILDFMDAMPASRAPVSLGRAVVGGAPLDAVLLRRLERDYRISAVAGWGMTETSALCGFNVPAGHWADLGASDLARIRLKQGRPVFGVDVRIVSESGCPLPHDGTARGELQVRGHWVIRSYLGKTPAETLTPDGWLPTGDVATIDALGHVALVDRLKDLIKSGGEWISSIEIEAAALSFPDIIEAAAIAVPDPRWGERPLLFVRFKNGVNTDLGGLRVHLQQLLAKWQVPERIELCRDALPLGPTGKISKIALRAGAAAGS